MRQMLSPMSCVMLAVAAAWSPQPAAAQRGRGNERWQQEAARHGWQLNYDGARSRARALGKPLMVVFRCIP